jgi:hypothetical protein
VAAECGLLDPWPSFTEAAPSAKRILVGRVMSSYAVDTADFAYEFQLRVDEVLRGSATSTLEFRGLTRSGLPLKLCPGDSFLRVKVGDVLAFAFEARVAGSPNPVLAVAWIHGSPDGFMLPGAEKLTIAQVRSLASMPQTDALAAPSNPSQGVPVWPLLAGVVGGCALLMRVRRGAPEASPPS